MCNFSYSHAMILIRMSQDNVQCQDLTFYPVGGKVLCSPQLPVPGKLPIKLLSILLYLLLSMPEWALGLQMCVLPSPTLTWVLEGEFRPSCLYSTHFAN